MLVSTISLSVQLKQNEAQPVLVVVGAQNIPEQKKKKKESIRQWQLKMKVFMCISNSTV